MYDHIKTMLQDPFKSVEDRDRFIKRFALNMKDEVKGIYHNAGYDNLLQQRGIFIRYEAGTVMNPKSVLTLSLSLHKFYNASKRGKLINWDDFRFCQANEAYTSLSNLLNIDLSNCIVKKYEVGINVLCQDSPDKYMNELSLIKVQARQMRIIEDVSQKEYKQYSTHKDSSKRIIYIFYNKTFEARSKQRDKTARNQIPDNILRIEKDTQRPVETILLKALFTEDFQRMTKDEFRQRFVEDLEYKATPIKTRYISEKRLKVIRMVNELGIDKAIETERMNLKAGRITENSFRVFRETAMKMKDKQIQYENFVSEKAGELKQLIINKLDEM